MRAPLLRRPADLEHLGILAVIAAWTIWFLQDSARASLSIENLMLIAPTAVVALGLCLLLAVRIVRGTAEAVDAPVPPALGDERRTLTFIALFAAYIGGLAYVAFDLSTFLFVAISLFLLGERNRILAIVYAAVFTLLSTAALREMLPYPFPSLLL